MIIDTHCHLSHGKLAGEAPAIVERARGAGLEACITIATGADDAGKALEIAERFPGFVAVAVGIDPFTAHRVGDGFDGELLRVERLLDHEAVCALGEIGLDFHYDLDPAAVQSRKFEAQLERGADRDLPVVIHVREAHDEMAQVLARHPRNRGVIHSFTAGPREAERYLELGWHLSFNGVITFKNAQDVRDAAQRTPAERLLVETDSPYLAPVPHRGKRCEPAYVVETLKRLALERDEPFEALARQTTVNARRLFGLLRLGAQDLTV